MTVTDDKDKPLDPVIRWQSAVGAIYDLVSAGPRVIFQEAGFLPVTPEIVQRIQNEAGLNVDDYLHIMDTDSIRHIIKTHGNQREILRGQLPIVRVDFLLIPTILADPEVIEYGGRTKPGRDTVRYRKTLDDYCYYYTEELRTKKNRLAAVTFYKRKI